MFNAHVHLHMFICWFNDLGRIYNFQNCRVHFMSGTGENAIHLYYLITLTHFNWVFWWIYCHLKSIRVSLQNKYINNTINSMSSMWIYQNLLQWYFVNMEKKKILWFLTPKMLSFLSLLFNLLLLLLIFVIKYSVCLYKVPSAIKHKKIYTNYVNHTFSTFHTYTFTSDWLNSN